ncbi:MAG: mtlR1, partial [Clostridiaceae bacterium]|nr:mtlR1 [Clostridiaceae bacterium]
LLYEYKPIDELLAYIYEDKQDPAIHVFFNMFFHKELISISKDILELVSSDMVKMDDMAYFSSLIHIMLSLKKAKLGSPINLPDYLIHDVISSNEFSFINKIKDYLISLNIDIPHSELVYIAIQLLGNKYVYKADGKFTELGVSLEELSKEVLYEVEKKLNIKINCDEQLIIGLSQHFNPALYRIKMGIQVKNPLVDEIKKYYGNLFNVVNHACRLVFSKYNITMPEDEIGFITMHVGAAIERTGNLSSKLSALIICPNGMGTARILLSKVKSAIPSIDRIAIKSFKDWSNSNDEYDIVLSTVNIDAEKNPRDNIIIVSPFLQQNDIDSINHYIKQHKGDVGSFNKITSFYKAENNNDSEEEKYEMINNMLKNLQLKTIDTKSFKEMIKLITENIYNENIINNREEVEELILNREKSGSVVIPNSSVALLHTRSNSVISPFVGVYRLKDCMKLTSVGFADEDVNTFIVLLARKTENPYILEQMGKISISLIEKKDFTENLRLGDIKDIRSSIIKILNEEDI